MTAVSLTLTKTFGGDLILHLTGCREIARLRRYHPGEESTHTGVDLAAALIAVDTDAAG